MGRKKSEDKTELLIHRIRTRLDDKVFQRGLKYLPPANAKRWERLREEFYLKIVLLFTAWIILWKLRCNN
jgi:hypothetical protein